MSKTIPCVILVFFLTVPAIFGQAQFIEKDELSLAFSAYYLTNGTDKPAGVSVGFAPSTEFDIGIGLGTNSGQNYLVHAFLYLNAWVINENNGRVPLSLRFNLLGEAFGYPESGFEHATRESHGSYNISASVHKNLAFLSSGTFQPFVGVGRTVLDDNETLFENGHWRFLAGISFCTGSDSKNVFFLNNDYSVIDDILTVSLSIGYMLGFKHTKTPRSKSPAR